MATVADVDFTAEGLTAHFLGREVYRHTRFVVVRSADRRRHRGGRGRPSRRRGPVRAGEGGRGARPPPRVRLRGRSRGRHGHPVVAGRGGPGAGARCPVRGGGGPVPARELHPRPPARSASGWATWSRRARPSSSTRPGGCWRVAEDLPPIELVPDVVDLVELARSRPSATYLLPCRGSGFELDGCRGRLPRPAPRPPGVDAARLRPLPGHPRVVLRRPARSDGRHLPPAAVHRRRPGDGPLLTKCCLLEDHNADEPGVAVVPWGASLDLVRRALARLAAAEEPAWAPA